MYYINIIKEERLLKRALIEKIKNKEYERLPDDTKNKIINQNESYVTDFLKNPILISKINT